MSLWPSLYREFVTERGLIGAAIEVPESEDLSGAGAWIEVLDEAGAEVEASDFFPGLVVIEDGFVPIGGCQLGSGDQYFLNVRDPQPGPVYRIYHDRVTDDGYDANQAIDRVLASYADLQKYVVP